MNPNIGKTPSTGPTTKVGKLVNSIHGVKPHTININPKSMAAQVVNFDNSQKEKSLQAYHNFVNWALDRKRPAKDLNEIAKLEGLMTIMEANLSKALDKIEEGKELTDKDRKDMFFMKDTLVAIHEMKYGRKNININTDLKDIRDFMFE